MRWGDSKTEHERKVERKRKELARRGFSEIRINQYMKDWSTFDVSTKSSRGRRARSYRQ